MQKEKTSIEVPEDIARAYRNAPPEKRKRAERAMAAALMSREDAAAELREILDRTGKTAKERGLTEEKLNQLLEDT